MSTGLSFGHLSNLIAYSRHFSAPPDTRSCDKFDHVVHAEGYANLLGRPEGTSKRAKPPNSPLQRSRSQQRFHVNARRGSLFNSSPDSSLFGSGVGSAKEYATRFEAGANEYAAQLGGNTASQSVALITALREATQKLSAEEVWDSMVNACESPELASPEPMARDISFLGSPANIAAVLTAASSVEGVSYRTPSPMRPSPRVSLPVKSQRRSSDEFLHKLSSVRSSRGSEHSLMSLSTAADGEGGTPSAESSSVFSSPGSPSRPQPRACRTSAATPRRVGILRAEQLKAQRRASWVA